MNHLPKSRTLNVAAIVCCICITLILPVFAQQQPPKDTVKLEANLVPVEAAVVNKRGEFVSGLTKEDFELFDGGRPADIAFFSEWSRNPAGVTGARARSTAAGPEGRSLSGNESSLTQPYGIFVIVLDDLHLTSEDLQRVRNPFMTLLSRNLHAGDRVALLTTSGRKWSFAQLSPDLTAISTALKQVGLLQSLTRPSFDKPLSAFRAFLIDQEGEDSDVANLTKKELANEGNGTAAGMLLLLVREVIQRSIQAANDVLAVLLQTISELKRAPGKKAVIFVSSGFVPRGSGFTSGPKLEQVADAALRAGVVVHTIDARGLVSIVPGGDASERASGIDVQLKSSLVTREIETTRQPLRDIAEMTGGIALDNNNDLSALFNRAVQASSQGYSLAFYPARDQEASKFKRLRLSIKGRPDLIVRTRAGYYPDPSVGRRQTEVNQTNAFDMLLQLAPPADLQIVSRAAFLSGTDGKATVRVSAGIPGSAIPSRAKSEKHEISLRFIGALYSIDGTVIEGFDETLNSHLQDNSFERLIRAGITYRRTYQVRKAGLYVSRVSIIDLDSHRAGMASIWLEIPSPGSTKIMISGPLVFQPGGGNSWSVKDGFSTISDYWFHAAAPLQIVTFISHGSMSDQSALKVSALLRPLSAPSESLVITNFGLLGSPALTAQGYTAMLPREVPPGAYTLQIFAEAGSEKSASRPVEFVLQFP